ncbi:hypothetical protein [Nostoc sp. UHCC 0870]|uniref:hypothetical protein n=1 Tax=Nostoc sp. UHCC 0870 TaxID=2914041 RepID=UPI001EDF8573|nr:hypothetical protein [Nostoc sp. UHCC 0870]UKO97342.1 hypothetical protein L6494_22600 [Nostoc sp. UHCC 0870]
MPNNGEESDRLNFIKTLKFGVFVVTLDEAENFWYPAYLYDRHGNFLQLSKD